LGVELVEGGGKGGRCGGRQGSGFEWGVDVNWEAVSAVAAIVQAAVILMTVVFAVIQLRDSRLGAKFDATRNLINQALDPGFYRALQFVFNELDGRLRDPQYASELSSSLGWAIDGERHPELLVLARLEEIGLYLKYRFISGDAVFNFLGELIVGSWEKLVPVVEIMRASHSNPNVWSNAESLYRATGAYLQRERQSRVIATTAR
jgi:hypothetical protein